jgi:undecaprenyl-diphosphatase
LLDHIPDASFPSDHASVSVAFLTALYLTGYKKVFWAFMPWVILMNLCRVIAGVHWPFDILAGTIV